MYQHGNWQKIFNEQIDLIRKSGLYDACESMHIGINGFYTPNFNDSKILYKINDMQDFEEGPTLLSVSDFAQNNPDHKILYLHSKGVTKNNKKVSDWRDLMNYFMIESWEECINYLKNFDAVGCNYSEDTWLGYHPHFSGNFWWANASYINELDDSMLTSSLRWDREFWIGSGNGKLYGIHNSKINHYEEDYPKERYK
jgi:hypothetical protein